MTTWTEEAPVSNTWAQDNLQAFQADAFQNDAFQVFTIFGTWTEDSSTPATWTAEEPPA